MNDCHLYVSPINHSASICLSVHPSIHQSIHPPIHPSIHLSIYLFIYLSILKQELSSRVWKRELVFVLLVHLFVLRVHVFVLFLFLLVSRVGCDLWLWHTLDHFSHYILGIRMLYRGKDYSQNFTRARISTVIHLGLLPI